MTWDLRRVKRGGLWLSAARSARSHSRYAHPCQFAGLVSKTAAMLRRLIISFYVLLFVGVAVGSAGFLWQTRAEYLRMREVEAQSRARLALAEERLREQRRTLERMRNDPAFVEMVIRRRLGYAKPDEFIFRFEQ